MTAKARTRIVLVNGDTLRVSQPINEMSVLWAQMGRSQAGSAFALDTITGHGTVKQVVIPTGSIFRLEEL